MWTTLTLILTVISAISISGQSKVRQLLQNERVSSYDLTIEPETVEPGFHEHKLPYFYVALSAGTARIRYPNGTSEVIDYKPGDARWGIAERHAVDNIGNTVLHFVIADIKDAVKPPS